MNGIWLAIEDIKRLWKTNVGINALGLMVFPLVYCYIYLLAFWDPIGNLHKLPLAVVNHDNGIVQGNMNINIGNDLVEKLVTNPDMAWHVVSQEEGDLGLNDGTYYLFLVIPEDFTAKAYSVGTPNPESALLVYKINEGASALGATITRRIMTEVGANLRHELYMNYLKEIFNQILGGARGLRQAADAASQLAAGTSQAYQGSAALTNGLQQSAQGINQLAAGLTKLQSGARELAAGAAQLNQAIGAGVALAEQYIDPIKAVLDVLSDLSKLVADVNTAIADIIAHIRQNNATLTAALPGLAAAEQKIDSLNQGSLADLDSIARQQASDLSAAADALRTVTADHPELKNDERISRALTSINRAADNQKRITQDVNNLRSSMSDLKEVFHKANIGIGQSQPELERNAQSIVSKLQALNFNEMTNRINSVKEKISGLPAKLNQLVEGTKKLQEGSSQLAAGLDTFASGFSALQSGNTKLLEGSTQLQNGLTKIDKGQQELAFKLNEAANAAAEESQPGKRIEVMADPVKIEEQNLHPVPANGVGFAPYFISLALWTGSLVLFSVIELKNVAVMPKRPISYMANKFLALASVSIFQSSLLIFILGIGLGLSPVTYQAQLFTFALIWGLVCCAIHFFLVYMLGHNPGQFFSIVLLMLQLASSGGSYPTELEPSFFTFLHPLLPMSYAVDGFRNLISIGNQVAIAKDTTILIGFGATFLILLYVLKSRKFLKEISEYE